MSDYIQRMEEENEELSNKLVKLDKFIQSSPKFENLSSVEQELMKAQYHAMTAYSYILDLRISYAYSRDNANTKLYDKFLGSSYN